MTTLRPARMRRYAHRMWWSAQRNADPLLRATCQAFGLLPWQMNLWPESPPRPSAHDVWVDSVARPIAEHLGSKLSRMAGADIRFVWADETSAVIE